MDAGTWDLRRLPQPLRIQPIRIRELGTAPARGAIDGDKFRANDLRRATVIPTRLNGPQKAPERSAGRGEDPCGATPAVSFLRLRYQEQMHAFVSCRRPRGRPQCQHDDRRRSSIQADAQRERVDGRRTAIDVLGRLHIAAGRATRRQGWPHLPQQVAGAPCPIHMSPAAGQGVAAV